MEDRGHTEYIAYPHFYRYLGTNDKFAQMRCSHCGKIRPVINPNYVSYYVKQKEAENAQKQAPKRPDKFQFNSHDAEHIKRGFDNYEGNLRKDLLQPFLSDGTPNPEFVKAYGNSIYQNLTPNV